MSAEPYELGAAERIDLLLFATASLGAAMQALRLDPCAVLAEDVALRLVAMARGAADLTELLAMQAPGRAH